MGNYESASADDRSFVTASSSAALPNFANTDWESVLNEEAKELNALQKKSVRVEALGGWQKDRKNSAAVARLRAAAHSQDTIVFFDHVLYKREP